MHIFITGATGLIGKKLTKRLIKASHQITILTRDLQNAQKIFGHEVSYCQNLFDFKNFNAFDAVINLAGEPIANKRWTSEQKKRLQESRFNITKQLSELITQSDSPPETFISGSAVGYYGRQGDNIVTETSQPHDEFTHELCAHWEALAQQASSDKTRICLLRTAIVLSSQGGALAKMLPAFRFGLGGVLGSGKQYMSWIHIDDMVDAIEFLLTTDTIHGPVNMCSPEPVTNLEFSHALARSLRRPCFLPIPACFLKLVLGEVSTILLHGQRAIPDKLQQSGFIFTYPKLSDAFDNLLT